MDSSFELAGKLRFPIALLIFSALVTPAGNFIVAVIGAIIHLLGWALLVPQLGYWEMFVALSFGSIAVLALSFLMKKTEKSDEAEKTDPVTGIKHTIFGILTVILIVTIQSFFGWAIAVKLLGIFSTDLIGLILLSFAGYVGVLAFFGLLERTGIFEWAKQHEKHL